MSGTVVYARQHGRGLTAAQLSAVDVLASGRTDKETAELLSLHRTTVTKWRLYDPVFIGALNERRAEIWRAGVDRLRALIPLALDALAVELTGPNRLKAATAILGLVPLPADVLKVGPTDPEEVVRKVVEERRAKARQPIDDITDAGTGLPDYHLQLAETWQELDAIVNEPDPPQLAQGEPGQNEKS